MKSSRPSQSEHSPGSQQRKNWLGRSDLVTFDVFKRIYWCHFPKTLTKGIGLSLHLAIITRSLSTRRTVPSVAFGDIIGAAFCSLYVYISATEKPSRDYQGFREIARVPKPRSRQGSL